MLLNKQQPSNRDELKPHLFTRCGTEQSISSIVKGCTAPSITTTLVFMFFARTQSANDHLKRPLAEVELILIEDNVRVY